MAPTLEDNDFVAVSIGGSTFDARQKLVQKIENQKILVPDLLSLMPEWRHGLQPDVDAINVEIDEWLKTYVCPSKWKSPSPSSIFFSLG